MCVAIFSKSGVGYPTKEIFKRCWDKNDDGAGYAYLTVEDEWCIKKGFMTFDAFWEAWEKEGFSELHTVAIHFRLGTSGKMVGYGRVAECHPGCTHPFPVTDEKEKLFETNITTKRIVMHNGVVGHGKGDLSDTMVAVLEHVDPLIPYLKDEKVLSLLTELIGGNEYQYGSRWWVADGVDTYLIGDWLKDSDIYYSKDDYLEPVELPETHGPYRTFGGQTSVMHDRPATIRVDKTLRAIDYLTKKLKTFSFVKWSKTENYINTTTEQIRAVHTQPEPSNITDDIVEVYNSEDKCIALIDGRTGETIYEKNDIPAEVDTSRHCVDCGAQIKRSETNDGLCPYCYKQLWPITGWEIEEDEKISCPSCGESSYIIDSTFATGDTECCQCGCLFWSTISGKDGIVGWNEDTKAWHASLMQSPNAEEAY